VFCCADCFGDDEYLAKKINAPHAHVGNCSYCQSQNVAIASPSDFQDEFEFLMSIYQATTGDKGKCIIDCMVADWELFLGKDRLSSVQLLGTILNDSSLGSKYFVPSSLAQVSPKEMWESFRNELITQHRFLPDNQPDSKYLPILFDYLVEEHASGHIFRARIQSGAAQFKKSEMGMPPPSLTRAGRANPTGIPYLYAASDYETAIAETRPHPGNIVSICKFKIIDKLQILSLINPRSKISPFEIAFLQGDEKYLLKLRHDVEFLCHLGTELSKPITPDVAELEYLPTQYLCELIKKSQFDGVKFQSSVGDGVNFTLFGQSKVKAHSVFSHYVKGLEYSTEKI
jgi:hypothetical protein